MAEGKGEEPVAATVVKEEGVVSVEKKGGGAVVSEAVEKAPAAEAGKRVEKESGRMITFKSSDGKQVKVTKASARLSELIGEMIDSDSAYNVIPLPKVDSKSLKKVIEYCDKHANFAANNKSGTDEEKGWDKTFISELYEDKGTFFAVILAAHYLDVGGLLDLTCQKVADTLKGKTSEEMRAAFNIVNDFTEEEEKGIRRENPWAFTEEGKRKENESGRIITLKSSDGDLFEVTEASARLSKAIENMIDDGCADPNIPLPNVDSKTLMKVIEYCDKHADKKSDTAEEKEELKNWDKAFIDELDEHMGSLVEVIKASNYLKIVGLHGLACQRVAKTIKGKTLEEIFKVFSISE